MTYWLSNIRLTGNRLISIAWIRDFRWLNNPIKSRSYDEFNLFEWISIMYCVNSIWMPKIYHFGFLGKVQLQRFGLWMVRYWCTEIIENHFKIIYHFYYLPNRNGPCLGPTKGAHNACIQGLPCLSVSLFRHHAQFLGDLINNGHLYERTHERFG